MTAEIADKILIVAALLVPFLAIVLIRNKFAAILMGTLSLWIIIDRAPYLIQKLDLEYEPNSPANAIWRGLGWIPALIYSASLYLIKHLICKVIRKYTGK